MSTETDDLDELIARVRAHYCLPGNDEVYRVTLAVEHLAARLAEVEAERHAATAEIAAYRNPGAPTYPALLASHAKLLDDADEWAAGYRELAAERDAAVAEREAWRPVVEAAVEWRQTLGSSREVMVFGHLVGKQTRAMIAAVDALPTRNFESTPTDPSLAVETLTPGGTDG